MSNHNVKISCYDSFIHVRYCTLLLVLICSIPAAAAHTTVSVDQYDIEVGWGIEPPIVGLRNDLIHISEPGDAGVSSGVKNAFRNMVIHHANSYR